MATETKVFKYFAWIVTLFITLLLVSNVIAGRLVEVFGIVSTSAMYLFPITYILGDIVPEVYGYTNARKLIWFGALANVIMVLAFLFVNALPAPRFFQGVAAYNLVLAAVPRVVLFSILGYWAGSFINAFVLARMKEWMVSWDPNHKWLGLRTVASTIAGEGVDSIIFIFGVFLFTMPLPAVVTMFFVQWAIKVIIEAVMTPVTYVVCKKLKKAEGVDVVGAETYTPFSLA
jgi:uncharacterized integral membrane protein (TIGR00697 family)